MAATVWSAVGCLPTGTSPTGQHLLAERLDSFVTYQPLVTGAPPRLLVLRWDEVTPTNAVQTASVFDVPAPTASGTVVQPNLLASHALYNGDSCIGCGFPEDARGRLFFSQVFGISSTGFEGSVIRVDPATNASTDLGSFDAFLFSPDRTRLLTRRGQTWTIRDLDDDETPLPPALDAQFVGGDIYFVSPDDALFQTSALGTTPRMVSTSVASFSIVDTSRGPLLVLTKTSTSMDGSARHALFDPATMTELPMPGESAPTYQPFVIPSPSGRYLLLEAYASTGQPLTMFDRDTGVAQTQTVDAPSLFQAWRPGHDQLWIDLGPEMFSWTPGGALTPVADQRSPYTAIAPEYQTIFTPDGASWISFELDGTATLRSADDPSATPLLLTPPGTHLSDCWPLVDGRGIVEVYPTSQLRNDIYLVDPVKRTSSILATGGHVVAVGANRILTLLNWIQSDLSGDLTMIDLANGAKTVLAENVHDVAISPAPAGLDRLPSGVTISYLVRNRIASPFDGLWSTTP
ncbi:MAG TPA: hypothetical protein VHJ20_21675 [Polyangia bacterium]|nr:hypothetical protein [Polyangia bacterium]